MGAMTELPEIPKGWTLGLRTCNDDMTSYEGFKWPTEIGSLVKPDQWIANGKCGNGLHYLPNGIGDYHYLDFTGKTLIIAARDCDMIDGDKAKTGEAMVLAVFDAKTIAPLNADYEAKRDPLYADYDAKRATLQKTFFAQLCKKAGIGRTQ